MREICAALTKKLRPWLVTLFPYLVVHWTIEYGNPSASPPLTGKSTLFVRQVYIVAPSWNTYIVLFPDIVSALLVLDDLIVLGLAAAEWDPARLPRANHRARAVEVDVLQIFFYLFFIFGGGFYFCFSFVLYSTLLHLPPLRFHCADGCWDRTQDRCNWCIGSQIL